ncbi:fungal-specific transcription factor domain-containing protein [Emericellopsis atlantica]|uniref:Fungal-specific transcription factor domain-containing protein n=1 Tax=Emericellopsis atlantica TaxID=2614577 RepID=A0A9P7ZTH8_9HYPO|nr:fungal-specific transcription factor domain-containing protein [Emericellopsis atlantica]KAG9257980.1 fungal-specific transcription factor domain-containing protein [Emericellopsis atlantica]
MPRTLALRKTRCDPTLPKCLPCERAGAICEYLDTTKGKRISRNYVILLQDKVRTLEAEMAQYVDEEGDDPHNSEDMVRPGGMVRLGAADETPRYLGPSSGIAMTRLLMEEAKRFTQSNRVADLIPDLKARRQHRMQSIQMSNQHSYPTISESPAARLPDIDTTRSIVEIFKQKGQVFWPVLHEVQFEADLQTVYDGKGDIFQKFVVHMVLAIGLQRMSITYAGLADAFFQSAMKDFEVILRPKDLKTLQCLVLIGQYSLITPTRVPIYYVIGLAAKICQQEGLVDEKTITTGYNLDPLTIDIRRRLVWTVASLELGLAHSLGRPSSFATGDEQLDVGFFATVDDEHITERGIAAGPPSPRKVVAIHAIKMRLLQADIRRTLYERKKDEPQNDSSPWFQQMEQKIMAWRDNCPETSPWCQSWFTSRYHQMRISMYRPSPQVSKPSAQAAKICYDSAKFIIELSKLQLDDGSIGMTWVFLLTLNMSLNTMLWSLSYPDVRQAYSKEDTEALVAKALDVLDGCEARWPGTSNSSELYSIFSKACLQSYETQGYHPNSILTTPPAASDTSASPESSAWPPGQQPPTFNPPQFGQVFDSPPEAMNNYVMDPNFPPPQPSFRSNSIFQNPATHDTHGRRFSYFPPDFTQLDDFAAAPEDPRAGGQATDRHFASPPNLTSQLSASSDSADAFSSAASNSTISPQVTQVQPALSMNMQATVSPSPKINPAQPQVSQRMPPYVNQQQQHQPARQTQGMAQQRPLPQGPPVVTTTASDWFGPSAAAFIAPYNFGGMGTGFYNDLSSGMDTFGEFTNSGLGLQGGGPNGAPQFDRPGRQGSLTQSQQIELMNVLETEGVGDIDAFLRAGNMQQQSQPQPQLRSDGTWY